MGRIHSYSTKLMAKAASVLLHEEWCLKTGGQLKSFLGLKKTNSGIRLLGGRNDS